jgi:hypothetical protein
MEHSVFMALSNNKILHSFFFSGRYRSGSGIIFEISIGISKSIETNGGILSQIRLEPVPSTSFPVR